MPRTGGKGEQQDRMMRAASQGFQQRQRSHEQMMAEGRAALERSQRGAATAGQLAEQGEARQLREDEGKATREQQAEQFKKRQEQQAEQFEASQKQQRDIATSRAAQQREQLDLAAAKEGIDRTGTAPNPLLDQQGVAQQQAAPEQQPQIGPQQPGALAPGEQGPITPEQAQEAQNLGEQVQQPVEMPGRGAMVPGQPTFQSSEAREERLSQAAANEELRARAYEQQVLTSAKRAQFARNKHEYKERVEQAKAGLGLNKMHKSIEKYINDEADPDWGMLKKLARNVPDPSLRQAIENKGASPEEKQRVRQFMQAHMNHQSMKFIAELGDVPSDDEGVAMIDVSSETYQRFENLFPESAEYIASQPKLADRARSVRDKNRLVRKFAAIKLLAGEGGGMPELGAINMPPSPGMAPSPMGEQAPGAGVGAGAGMDPGLQQAEQMRQQATGNVMGTLMGQPQLGQ